MSVSPVVEFITIGREILDGRVIDTNAVKMAEALRPLGLIPRHGQRVDDAIERIVGAFEIAASRSQVILVTGGLGPTSDDLTSEAFAAFLGEKLEFRPEAMAQIEDYLKKMSRPLVDTQRKQAYFAPSCLILPNPVGTAPGFGLERDGRQWYFMPGVPREMLLMMKEQVVPRLPRRELYRTMNWATQFTAESALQQKLNPVEARLPPGFEITYQTRFPENHVGLCADCAGSGDASRFEEFCSEIASVLSDEAFTSARVPSELRTLESIVVDALRARGLKIVLTEESTGGHLADRLTGVAGHEAVFAGAVVVGGGETSALDPSAARDRAESLAKAGRREGHVSVAVAGTYSAVALPDGQVLSEEAVPRLALDTPRFKTFQSQKALDLVRRSLKRAK